MITLLNKNKRYCVVGAGLTGLASLRFLLSIGCDVVLLDTRSDVPNRKEIITEFPNIELFFGGLDEFECNSSDILIVSPGIALSESFVIQAKNQGAYISSDIEIFLTVNTKPVVTVTGSNGKSTVVTLLAHVLNSVNVKAAAIGNIGVPVLDAANLDVDVFIIELSSFQLERLTQCPSDVACILNVSEDHLDRYDSMQDYVAAKQVIYCGAKSVVVNAPDKLTRYQGSVNKLSFGSKSSGADAYYEANKNSADLYINHSYLLNANTLNLKGFHNIENVLAVIAMLKQLKSLGIITADLSDCVGALRSYSGLPHRCQFVTSIQSVDYINDSKATNVGASLAALKGLQSAYQAIVILLGGVDKDSDFSELVNYSKQHNVEAIIYGRDARKISAEFELQSVAYRLVESFNQALTLAMNSVSNNCAVLLSPACASFDEFKSFNERGDAFINAVMSEKSQKEFVC